MLIPSLLIPTLLLGGCASGRGAATPAPAANVPSAPARSSPAARVPAPTSSPTTSPATPSPTASEPLAGVTIGIDPGHNGGNAGAAAVINTPVFNGREQEACDTTGTQTDAGYAESAFTFAVAQDLEAVLQAQGARVVLTRTSNTGVGPCITTRAQILNSSGAQVAISIHADGGPPTGRGFTILEPVADGINNAVVAPSIQFGADIRASMLRLTTMPVSSYDGVDGVSFRSDLAGVNLTTVPKVFLECGNMRNSTDAALLTSASFQHSVALAVDAAMREFLHR